MIRTFCGVMAAALAGMALAPVAAPVAASERPVRWTTGAAVWSTPQQAVDTFLSTGQVTDRGLDGGLNGAGWSPEEIRAAMNKPYSVDLAALDRFLSSPAGAAALQPQLRTYYPYWSGGRTGLQALRAAILSDAADGRISAASILARLPTDMRLTPGCPAGAAACPPLLIWWVFLPARLQAGLIRSPLASSPPGRSAAGAPAAAAAVAPAAR
ncbi:MAG: alpha/beta hydrolase [Cyanobacteriota bacterium]